MTNVSDTASTPDSPQGRWAAVKRLSDAWAARYPRRETGGLTALVGFRYQFLIVLRDTVRAWHQRTEADRRQPTVVTEALSDILDASGSAVLVTQVKHRQSSGAVRSALEELWLIDRLAFDEAPDLAPSLRYRIVSAEPELREVRRTIAAWSPSGVAPNDASVSQFRGRVETQIDESPDLDLLGALANLGADRPLDLLHEWLGLMVAEIPQPGGVHRVALSLWNHLHSLASAAASSSPPEFYLWQLADQPPTEVVPGEVLVGERPGPAQLRAGHFAPRAAVIDQVLHALRRWQDEQRATRQRSIQLPVFWIGGRSGCGKSIALLHVLARLRVGAPVLILYLGSNVARLQDALRWVRRVRSPGQPAIIALDDPYAPGGHGDPLQIWQRALSDQLFDTYDDLPLILACGPTEQAEALEVDFPDDVSVHVEELPTDTRGEHAELRAWYQRRKGASAPDVGDENVLLVQLFFEWATGQSISQFARRFQNRLRALDSDGTAADWVARILALNRLYVGYSQVALAKVLSPAQQDALHRLYREHHLFTDPDDDRLGVWLGHPHLANALYEAWHPADRTRNVRRDHLSRGIKDALAHETTPRRQTAPLWAVARGLGAGRDATIADRLASDDVASALSAVHAAMYQQPGGTTPVAHLGIWIELQRRAALRLAPDPVTQALAALNRASLEEIGLRLACHKLLQHHAAPDDPRSIEVAAATLALLARGASWREWLPVALDASARIDTPAMWEILRVGLWRRLDDVRAARGLQVIVEERASTGARALALDWLREAPRTLQPWVWVWQALLAASPRDVDLQQLGRDWLSAGRPEDPSWGFVWETLWKTSAADPELASLARAWLAAVPPDHGSWAFVWTALWKTSAADPELASLARAWLAAAPPDHGSWAFVWTALWKTSAADPELASLARAWLAAAPPDHGSWAFVWTALWKTSAADPELASLARAWLAAAPPDHGSWAFVWTALWKTSAADPELASLARAWLAAASPDHGSWTFVWEALWETSAADPALASLARAWLAAAPPDHGSWAFVWTALWKTSAADPELASLARAWLAAAPPDHGSWKYVWEALWKTSAADPELASLARAWLAAAPPDHGSWAFVWTALWKMSTGDARLIELGLAWLRRAPLHRSWAFVWLCPPRVRAWQRTSDSAR
jgi:hypothetical protein